MKTLKAIKYQEGYLFVDLHADPYPLGLHLKKNEIINVKGVGEKSGEVFHDKGFNYAGEIVKIVGQCNLDVPNVSHVEIDMNFFDRELREHRELIKQVVTAHEQDRLLIQCDMISYLKQKYKSIQQKKYTEDDLAHGLLEMARYVIENRNNSIDVGEQIKHIIDTLTPTIESIDIETIHVMPQENGTRTDGKIIDEISLNPLFNTLEVPTIYYRYGKEHLTPIRINYEDEAIKES